MVFLKKVAQLSFQNPKRHGKISQLVLSKLSFKKNKSYMKIKHKNTSYMPLQLI